MTEYLDLKENYMVGTMPQEICNGKLEALIADCHTLKPDVKCDCCAGRCEGLPGRHVTIRRQRRKWMVHFELRSIWKPVVKQY
jgi:hypothetical protein